VFPIYPLLFNFQLSPEPSVCTRLQEC